MPTDGTPRAGLALAVLLSALAMAAPAPAAAAPPPNDAAAGAGAFEAVTAADGRPRELQAIGELVEAAPDAGVPRCLGARSFARTVWYRVPAAEVPQEVTVEAVGQTLAVVDLAAFVQPEGATAPSTRQPNACSGVGAGGSDAAEEPSSAVTLRVPARRDVLVQVGRRGAAGSADNERVLLTLDTQALDPVVPPDGDKADSGTTLAGLGRNNLVRLFGATTTQEDPAVPACPSLATMWRRVVPPRAGPLLVSVSGSSASTLTAFAGARPTDNNALDCVDRAGSGDLRLRAPARAGKPLWVRIGADAPSKGAAAKLRVNDAGDDVVVNGGPGGFDPTAGGPGGGLPAACDRARVESALIKGPRFGGDPKRLNRRATLPVTIDVRGGPVCDVTTTLEGPGGKVYARLRGIWLHGRRAVKLRRTRDLKKGIYRLHVIAASELGGRVTVRTRVSGRLR